jgi:hypothetical protein
MVRLNYLYFQIRIPLRGIPLRGIIGGILKRGN